MAKQVNLEVSIAKENLDDIGSIDDLRDQYGKSYRFIQRESKPVGILYHDSMALKLYHMVRKTEPMPKNLVDGLEDFLISEIDNGHIHTEQGIGFAILSQGFLSVNLWGRGNVLFTQTYTVEANYPELSREPLEKTGVACTWEARIMSHEYEMWHKYLMSPMQSEDKIRYLQNFIAGDL
ncbi:MAG: hypothetical protein ABIG89_04585 [Candidatus Woesearchaeota archaeon]